MSIERFTCPQCQAALKPSKPIPEGKKVKCPRCNAIITISVALALPSADAPQTQQTRGKSSETEEQALRRAEKVQKTAGTESQPGKRTLDATGNEVKTKGMEAETDSAFVLCPAVTAEKSARPQPSVDQRPTLIGLAPLDPSDHAPSTKEKVEPANKARQPTEKQTPSGPAQAGKQASKLQHSPAGAAKESLTFEKYGFADEPKDDNQDEEKSQSRLHEGDQTNYDPRGPAQAAVVGPTNLLLITGGIGALGWFILSMMVAVMILFPPVRVSRDPEVPPGWQAGILIGPGLGAHMYEKIPKDPPGTEDGKAPSSFSGGPLKALGLGWVVGLPGWLGLLLALLFLLPAAYCGLIAIGAVKAHNLESRGWGMMASALALVPITVGGWLWLTLPLAYTLLFDVFLEPTNKTDLVIGWSALILIASLMCGWGIRVGLQNFWTLMQPEVIEGFEYEPE